MEKSKEYILFEQRLNNAIKQTTDLMQTAPGEDEQFAFGVTTDELWGTAKFQFSEAKRVAQELTGEEKEKAGKAIAGFREMFNSVISCLE